MRNRKELSVLVILILLLASCGGGKQSIKPQADTAGDTFSGRQLRLDAALAAVDSLQAPPDSETERFSGLQRELARLLVEQATASRHISVPQMDVKDRVTLSYSNGALHWQYRNTGDYDQNGEVNAADLIPLAILLGTGGGPFEFYTTESVVDGDGNGEINIADVAPIAQHYGVRITEYGVYASSNQADYPDDDPLAENGPGTQLLGMVEQPDTLPVPGIVGRKQYGFELQQKPGMSFWVRPLDGTQAGIASTLLASDLWQMAGVSSRQDRRSAYPGPSRSELRWKIDSGETQFSEAVPGVDGNVFVCDFEGNVYSINLVGEVVWSFESGEDIRTSPAVSSDGSVVFVSRQSISKLSATGELLWSFPNGWWSSSAPLVTDSGLILVMRGSEDLLAIDSKGQQVWSLPIDIQDWERPAASNGMIYCKTGSNQLSALNDSGTLLWQFETEGEIVTTPAVGEDGSVYVGTEAGMVYSIDANGTQDWSYANPLPIATDIALLWNGSVVICDDGANVVCISSSGHELWSNKIREGVNSAPLVDAESRIFLCTYSGPIVAFDKHGEKIWESTGNTHLRKPGIGPAGSLYAVVDLGDSRGDLVSIGNFPGQLRASDGDFGDRIELEWDAVPGADSYSLQFRNYQGGDPAVWTDLANIAQSAQPSYSHSSPDALCEQNTAYEYRVTLSQDGVALSVWSNTDTGYRYDSSQPMVSWPVFSCNAQGTFRSPFAGPETASINWKFIPDYPNTSPPVIDAQGRVYFTSSDGYLYSVSPEGDLNWKIDLGCVGTLPSISAGGLILVSTLDGLRAVNQEAELQWEFNFGEDQVFWTVPLGDGRILVTGSLGSLHELNEQGQLLWGLDEGSRVNSIPVVRPDGTVLFTVSQGGLNAYDDNRNFLWERDPQGQHLHSPALASDGIVYAWDFHEKLYAVDMDGSIKWSRSYGQYMQHTGIACSGDGTLYLGFGEAPGDMHPNLLTALNSHGGILWQLDLGEDFFWTPVIDNKGVIYMSTSDVELSNNSLFAVNPDGTIKWQLKDDNVFAFTQVAIGSHGDLFATVNRGLLRIGH